MLPRRLALLLVVLAALLPAALRLALSRPTARRDCAPEGRGEPPRTWVGCAADAGPRRALGEGERFLLGMAMDPNRASAAELALVPGLSPRLAAAVVADREARGPYRHPRELRRVPGIGPARLAAAAPHLAVADGEVDGAGPAPGARREPVRATLRPPGASRPRRRSGSVPAPGRPPGLERGRGPPRRRRGSGPRRRSRR